jgi:hypothetical protein
MDSLPEISKSYPALALISVLLLSVMVGVQLVFLAEANPYYQAGPTPPPQDAKPPKISVSSPESDSILASNDILLKFNATVGESTTPYLTIISKVHYKADWQQSNTTVYIDSFVYDHGAVESSLNQVDFSRNLTDIPDGNHSITIYAIEKGWYVSAGGPVSPLGVVHDFSISNSYIVNFTIDTTPPNISLLSLENETYNAEGIPLNFAVNEAISQISYVLDGTENVTVSGNVTLSGLSEGKHNVTVYAWDAAGNIGASETVTFTIAKPEPPEPFPTAQVAVASLATVAVAGSGLLAYFKKQKRKSQTT